MGIWLFLCFIIFSQFSMGISRLIKKNEINLRQGCVSLIWGLWKNSFSNQLFRESGPVQSISIGPPRPENVWNIALEMSTTELLKMFYVALSTIETYMLFKVVLCLYTYFEAATLSRIASSIEMSSHKVASLQQSFVIDNRGLQFSTSVNQFNG